MIYKRLAAVAAAVLMLGGCAYHFTRVPTGVWTDSSEKFSAEINGEDWMRNPVAGAFVISRDGFSINYILVKRDKLGRDLSTNKQRFTVGMEPWELAEVQLDILEADFRVTDFQLIANRPQTISGHPGYCLEYQYTNHQGVGVSGVRCGAAADPYIYLIVYEGVTEHYFAANRPVFEHFLKTFKGL